jgi:hypothetical protein
MTVNLLRQHLAQLESLYAKAAARRRDIDAEHGPGNSNPKTFAIAQARAGYAGEISDLKSRIKNAFANARGGVIIRRNDARRAFANSSEGRSYTETLAAFGTVAMSMPADVLARKITDALDSGLVGQAKALAELASYRSDSSAALHTATYRASEEAKTQLEAAADAEEAYISQAEASYRVVSGYAEMRLEDAISGRDDFRQGFYDPARVLDNAEPVFDGTQAPKAQSGHMTNPTVVRADGGDYGSHMTPLGSGLR